MSTFPLISRVTPLDFYELVIEFAEQEFRVFPPAAKGLYTAFPFLAYPNKLKAFTHDASGITWFNATSLNHVFLYQHSEPVSLADLANKSLTISFKNQAPTSSHPSHHEYRVSVLPFHPEKMIALSESIGGGFADMGGSVSLSIRELSEYPGWRTHLQLSGCDWAVPLIETHHNDLQTLRDGLVREVCKRSNPF